MRFAEPTWLGPGLGATLALLGLMIWASRRRAKALRRLVANEHVAWLTGSLSLARRRLKQACLLAATGCLFIALARPQWGFHEEARRQQGTDLLLAVDTSKSMLAEDLRPTRLARAKLAIEDLIERVRGERLGLVAFAGDAFLQTPLTHDRAAFAQSLAALEPGVIPVGGTDLESAIRVAERAFASSSDQQKVLVLLSDGEDLAGGALDAARRAANAKLVIHTVGIGTAQGAELALRDEQGRPELVRGPDGALVHSRLDEGLLRRIAELTGGSYHLLGADGRGLEQLYREALAGAQATGMYKERVYHERFQWPLACALMLVLLEWWLDERRRTRARALPALAVAALLLAPSWVRADAPVERYNAAVAHYRQGEFAGAVEEYQRALNTRDLALQQRTYYDLGNARFRAGQAALASDRDRAIGDYEAAIEAYDAALALNEGDDDARFNRDFVRARLAELEQQRADEPEQKDDGAKPDSEQGDGAAQQDGSQEKRGDDAAAANEGAGEDPNARGEQPGRDGADERGKAQPTEAGALAEGESERDEPGAAASGGLRHGEGESERDERGMAVTGGLSHGEAEQLLDALQGELRQLPSASGQHARRDAPSREDW
jgi:Ca-activated chloride channel homolog